jgi:GNAT superfamily N-acetyltransferase
MIFREANTADIKQIQIIRNAVKENTLSNPNLVTDSDCENFLTNRGKGWVCLIDETVVGFAIADLVEDNIWALFVHPEAEKKGIGKKLHQLMLNWYFSQAKEKVWLGTSPNTRAEKFYTLQGWQKVGLHEKNEIKFEITKQQWQNISKAE